MAGVILGLEFALMNDVDYVMYVEQDALLYGRNLVSNVEAGLLRSDFLFGRATDGGDIQQSVFAVSKRGIKRFLSALHSISYSDKLIQPELKFMYAASALRRVPMLGMASWDNPRLVRRAYALMLNQLLALTREYDYLPFGYGRTRPIDYRDPVFYFQHGDDSEILKYRELTGF